MGEALLGRVVDDLPPGSLVLRPMTQEDVAPAGELAQAQRRNLGADDFARFLGLEGARGYALVREGELLGVATAMRYFEHAFLGPVVLREGGDGLVIALLGRLVEALQREGVVAFEAEAGAAEEPVLARMGFATVRRTLVLERAPVEAPAAPAASEPMRPHHLLDVGALDAAAVGYGRKGFLAALLHELPEGARVAEREGDIVGYALLRRAPRGFALGPVVTRADDAEAAASLVRDALAPAAGAPVVMLVPEGTPLQPTLEREGFERVGSLVRMRAGRREDAEQPVMEWALGSRMTG